MEKMMLLLVDDEQRFLTTTQKIFKMHGDEILTASSGGEAMKMIESHPVNVVILDVKMPHVDGLETLKKIRKKDPFIQTILLTGHGTMESAATGISLGAAEYLIKPVDVQILREKAFQAFGKWKMAVRTGNNPS